MVASAESGHRTGGDARLSSSVYFLNEIPLWLRWRSDFELTSIFPGTEVVPGFAGIARSGGDGLRLEDRSATRRLPGRLRPGYVPEVERDHVGDQDVDVMGGVFRFLLFVAVGGLHLISAGVDGLRALDLNAQATLAVVEDEVVAVAVAPGLGEFQAEEFGFVEEGGLGQLSDTLGVATGGGSGEDLFGSGSGFGRGWSWGCGVRRELRRLEWIR